jgi:hypothetical protein
MIKPLTKLSLLADDFHALIYRLMENMAHEGYPCHVVETRRSPARQKELYAIGRRRIPDERPVTWTMDSKHLHGKAVDFCHPVTGYTDPAFFKALGHHARRLKLRQRASEPCHIEQP